MKYELMALVNQMSRTEEFTELASRFAHVYDEINNGKVKADPVKVGEYLTEITDNYFKQVEGVVTKEKSIDVRPNIEYKKPFFVDPDEILAKENGTPQVRYENFINDLCDILDIKATGFGDNMNNKMALIKKRLTIANGNPRFL
jgi:hypothetical protein